MNRQRLSPAAIEQREVAILLKGQVISARQGVEWRGHWLSAKDCVEVSLSKTQKPRWVGCHFAWQPGEYSQGVKVLYSMISSIKGRREGRLCFPAFVRWKSKQTADEQSRSKRTIGFWIILARNGFWSMRLLIRVCAAGMLTHGLL